jgi:hypothetical protein
MIMMMIGQLAHDHNRGKCPRVCHVFGTITFISSHACKGPSSNCWRSLAWLSLFGQIMRQSQPQTTAAPWVEAFAYAEFDADLGQVMQSSFPQAGVREAYRQFMSKAALLFLQLSESQGQKVARLALPDSNTGQLGDSIHCFRSRR